MTSITVSWSATAGAFQSQTDPLRYKLADDQGTVYADALASVSSPYTISGLNPGTSLNLSLTAYGQTNVAVENAAATFSASTISATAPDAPTDLAASPAYATSAVLTWSVGAAGTYDGSNDTSQFLVCDAQDRVLATLNAATTTYTVSGLTAGTSYTFSVKARGVSSGLSSSAL
mgnify:CR=1 FL=1